VPQKRFTIKTFTHRKWIDKSTVMSNVEGNLPLILARTQARRLMRSREQLTS
jgi:hypothetical protein